MVIVWIYFARPVEDKTTWAWVSEAESIFLPKVDSHGPIRVKGLSLRCSVGKINLR